MKLGLLVFGQFRAWEDVLENNLNQFKDQFSSCQLDLFILTDKSKGSMYSENTEKQIKELILKIPQIKMQLFTFWEDLKDLHATDALMLEYCKLNTKGRIHSKNYWMVNLWYRRYVLMKLVEQQVNWNSYDYFIFNPLFDTSIIFLKPILPLLEKSSSKDTLFMCVDSLFIGSPGIMKKLLNFGAIVTNWKEFIWTPEFISSFESWDSIVSKQITVLCSESQIFYYIYTNFPKFQNIRYDFTTKESPSHIDSFINVQIVKHMPIPKSIIQIALGDLYVSSLPLQLLQDNLVQHNSGFTYRLLLEKDCIEFLTTHFPQYLPLFHSLQRPQYKSDLIRYLWLYIHGGWYIDIDLLPLVPLRKLYEITEQADIIVSFGANHTFEMANGFLASVSGQELFLNLVNQMACDPNPPDFGMNVKRMFKTCKETFSIEPFQNRNGVFSLLEQQLQPGKYFICYGNQPVVVSNGNGYPPKA